MSLTDPQDDVPCRGCETEGPPARLDDDGLCRRCRVEAAEVDTRIADAVAAERQVEMLTAERDGLLARVGADALAEVER